MGEIKGFFSKTFPILRDVLIFTAALVTVVFNYLASPVREDIRTVKSDIKAIEVSAAVHKSDNDKSEIDVNTKLDKIFVALNNANAKLARIEGKLEK